ncbi:hypothetical protein SeMB42_g04904 [Synchytrium endobioticum]|uniref:Guanine nucleotide-binding protein subunit gamma n=1 Tax=Synchytrium endobioticum TaxID=286115 RepID=A0A507CV62_9FUNG|nr:hypothetical protein SeMB42_g04904 [Synchytrium endobioticum]
MSEIKLKKLLELNQRLKETLDLPRIPVSEASTSLIKYITSTKDFLLPSVWGSVDKKDDPYSAPSVKRTRANLLARVLEDAGCFEAHHCQSLNTVRYCETCSTVWDRDYNAARNILYCFLYERVFAERPRPFKLGTNTESD